MKDIKKCQEEIRVLKMRLSEKKVREESKIQESKKGKTKKGRECPSCGRVFENRQQLYKWLFGE